MITITHMPPRGTNPPTPWCVANGVPVVLGPDATPEQLEREACRIFGQDWQGYLIAKNWAIATKISDDVADARGMLKLMNLRDSLPAEHPAVAMINALQQWMDGTLWGQRYYTIKGEILAGTRAWVSELDYADVATPPYWFGDVLGALQP